VKKDMKPVSRRAFFKTGLCISFAAGHDLYMSTSFCRSVKHRGGCSGFLSGRFAYGLAQTGHLTRSSREALGGRKARWRGGCGFCRVGPAATALATSSFTHVRHGRYAGPDHGLMPASHWLFLADGAVLRRSPEGALGPWRRHLTAALGSEVLSAGAAAAFALAITAVAVFASDGAALLRRLTGSSCQRPAQGLRRLTLSVSSFAQQFSSAFDVIADIFEPKC